MGAVQSYSTSTSLSLCWRNRPHRWNEWRSRRRHATRSPDMRSAVNASRSLTPIFRGQNRDHQRRRGLCTARWLSRSRDRVDSNTAGNRGTITMPSCTRRKRRPTSQQAGAPPVCADGPAECSPKQGRVRASHRKYQTVPLKRSSRPAGLALRRCAFVRVWPAHPCQSRRSEPCAIGVPQQC